MSFDVIVPALALRSADGTTDFAATRRYATRAASTWVDRFILSGSTTEGHQLSARERADILDLWLEVAEPTRLLACCWEPRDFTYASDRSITPMAVMQCQTRRDAVAFLRDLPVGSTIYSHPMLGSAVFGHDLAAEARDHDVLPSGGKLAKITTDQIADIHAVTGDAFQLWDGSSRHIAASLAAGAAGMVVTPLSPFRDDFPVRDAADVQASVDPIQDTLDSLPSRKARTNALLHSAATCSV